MTGLLLSLIYAESRDAVGRRSMNQTKKTKTVIVRGRSLCKKTCQSRARHWPKHGFLIQSGVPLIFNSQFTIQAFSRRSYPRLNFQVFFFVLRARPVNVRACCSACTVTTHEPHSLKQKVLDSDFRNQIKSPSLRPAALILVFIRYLASLMVNHAVLILKTC